MFDVLTTGAVVDELRRTVLDIAPTSASVLITCPSVMLSSVCTVSAAVTTADSEHTMSYEAGVKTVLLDRRLRFNLTGYYFKTKDLQLSAVGGQTNANLLLNAATPRSPSDLIYRVHIGGHQAGWAGCPAVDSLRHQQCTR